MSPHTRQRAGLALEALTGIYKRDLRLIMTHAGVGPELCRAVTLAPYKLGVTVSIQTVVLASV